MDWETELITLYFLVSQNAEKIFSESMRMSPNSVPEFTDAELIRTAEADHILVL